MCSGAGDLFGLVGASLDNGKYSVESCVGSGGYGVVYRAKDHRLNRYVAIKCLKRALTRPADTEDDARSVTATPQQEPRALVEAFQHPNVVKIFAQDSITHNGKHISYLVLEWLDGCNLKDFLKKRRAPFSEVDAIELLCPVIDAVAFMHDRGFAHADLKPSNLFLHGVKPEQARSGPIPAAELAKSIRVLDFGTATFWQAADQQTAQTLCNIGAPPPFGTVGYQAPEQHLRKGVSSYFPIDVHALALLLVELVTGRRALEGKGVDLSLAILNKHRPTPRAKGAHVSDGFETILAKALAHNPNHRHRNACELLRDLQSHIGAALQVAVRAAPQGRALLHGVPPLPSQHVKLKSAPSELKRSLLMPAADQQPSNASRVGLWGTAGIGKTVLATALVEEVEIRQRFSDGVYWITLGQKPNVMAQQGELMSMLGKADEARKIQSENLGVVALREVLSEKRILLVLDDVWDAAHTEAFNALGPESGLLVTTRNREILTALDATQCRVGSLSPDDSMRLMAKWCRRAPDDLPPIALEVARECGYLPLALAIVSALTIDTATWEDILSALYEGDIKYLEHAHRSVFKALDISVRALPEGDRDRYLELGIFPPDVAVPVRAVLRLWESAGMTIRHASRLLARLANRALLETSDGLPESTTVLLHDLIGDYVRCNIKAASAAHARLVQAYREELPREDSEPARWELLNLKEQYFWRYLFHHLLGADQRDTLESLVRSVKWLQAKIAAQTTSDLLADLAMLVERSPADAIRRVWHALSSESAWLHLHPEALLSLLYNRLLSDGMPGPHIEHMMCGERPAVRLMHPVNFGREQVYRGHTGRVTAFAYSPDGRRVLSAADDGTLREWNAATSQELRRFDVHTMVTDCAYSPDGKRVLLRDQYDYLEEWDLVNNRGLLRFKGSGAYAYSPDGKRVLSASDDSALREWDVDTGQELRRFDGHTKEVTACAYSPNGKRVLSASYDNTLREWDVDTGQELRRFDGHTKKVTACAYSPNGRRVLSASDDSTLREWDVGTGQELRRFDGHTKEVTACAYSPNGRRVLSASDDSTLREWDVDTGSELQCFEWSAATAWACSPDGERLLWTPGDNTLREWDLAIGSELCWFNWHTREVTCCAYSPDGRRVLSASCDKTLREWNVVTGQELQRFEVQTEGNIACAYSPDGKHVLSASDFALYEWDVATGGKVQLFGRPPTEVVCAYSPDGRRALSAFWCHMTERRKIEDDYGHGEQVPALAYSPDGKRVLSAFWCDMTEQDVVTGRVIEIYDGHEEQVTACAYSPNGKRVLSASCDKTLREWDVDTGQELRRFNGHTEMVTACAYSPSGKRVLSASRDQTLREWDVATGWECRRFAGHTAAVTACAYSPDGEHAISSSKDATVKLWCVATAACIGTVFGVGEFTCIAVAPYQIVAGDIVGNLWFLECDWF